LTNFRFTSLASPLKILVEDFSVEIGRLGWRNQGEIEEHSSAYQHPMVSTYLRMKDVPLVKQSKAIECLQGIVELLSIAQRGYTFIVAQHTYDAEGRWLDSRFTEPNFTSRGWLRPLIPDESLADFLKATYPHLTTKYQNLQLANVIDHYLQALTLRSAWPTSLGIFTAMETLKTAFFRQTEDAEDSKHEFWVIPYDTFEKEPDLLNELIDVLCRHFPRFCNLKKGERDSLKAQLKGLNRRSYKTQLKRMLDRLEVNYHKNELQPFISIRNRIIHQGTPAEGKSSGTEYEHRASQAWEQIEAAISLFERILLTVLGYRGTSGLFDA